MTTAILCEIDVTSPAGVAATLRFSDRAVRPMPPGDPDKPNAVWDDRIISPPSLRRALFQDVASLTPAIVAGAMTLANADRALDAYQAHAFGEIRVWRWNEGGAFSTSTLLFQAVCSLPGYGIDSASPGRVTIYLADYRAELGKPLQGDLYAGTGGYEGAADGLKGSPKPLAYGRLDDAHIPAPQVEAASLSYQLHDGLIAGAAQIFDRGDDGGYIDDGDYSGALFDAHAPTAAHYATDLGRGLIKFSGATVGKATFGLRGDSSGAGYVETPGPVLARILGQAGVAGGRIGASVTGLASAAPVGAWFGQAVTADAAMTPIVQAAGAALIPDRSGVWQALTFAAPVVTADHTIDVDEVIKISADQTAPAPVGEVRIGWGQIYSTFTGSELAAALKGTDAEARLASAWRYTSSVDATVKTRFPTSYRTLTINTALRLEADAQALGDSLLALFALRPDGKPRRLWSVVLDLTDDRLAAVLGDTIGLDYPPAGINDNFVLIGEELLRPRRDQVTWSLWG